MRRLIATLLLLAAAHADAQSFPSKPVTIILMQPPGGANDVVARALAKQLQESWAQPVLVEYRPGGGSVVGTLAVARSAPDGHTMGLINGAYAIIASARKDLPYDPAKDLAPVARLNLATLALVAMPSVPAATVAEAIALAKQKQGPVSQTYGTNGVGTGGHLAGELFNMMAGVSWVHVPYKGGAQLYQDMLGGRLPFAFAILGSAMQHVKAGRMKVLGVTTEARSQVYPHFPAISETLPGFAMPGWGGLVAAGRTPEELINRLSGDVVRAAKSAEIRKLLIDADMEPAELPAREFDQFIRAEIERAGAVIRRSGIILE